MRCVWFAVAVIGVTVAKADGADSDANFTRCLAQDPWCDLSALSEDQRRRVYDEAAKHHLQACLSGKRCNEARLDAETREEVRMAVARLNLETCLNGDGPCRYDDLSVDELALVIESDRRRNLERCYSGVTACNENWLTKEQREEAQRRYVERNFNSCMETFGTLLPCNAQDLTSAQTVRYRERLLERNYFACLLGLIGCNMDVLTSQQRDEVMAKQRVGFGSQRK